MNGHANGVNVHEEPVPLPSAKAYDISGNIIIQPPLTRLGHGPGLVLIVPSGLDLSTSDKTLDLPPLQKWAEEGFAVAQITIGNDDSSTFQKHWQDAIAALAKLSECDSTDRLGLICKDIMVL